MLQTSLFYKVIYHFSYLPILVIATVLSFSKFLIYARILQVPEFGILAKLFIISNLFGALGSIGFHLLAHREVPALLLKKNDAEALRVLSVAAVVASSLAGLALLLGFIFWAISRDANLSFWTIAVVHGWLNHMFTIVTIESKSRLSMFRYSGSVFVRSFVVLAVGSIAANRYGSAIVVVFVESVVSAVLIAWFVKSLISHTQRKAISEFIDNIKQNNWSLVPRSGEWRIVLVLFSATLVSTAGVNLDRWLAGLGLSSVGFGLYAFAWIGITAAQSLQQIISAGFFPVVARTVASNSKARGFWITALGSSMLIISGLFATWAALLLSPLVIERWYPEYSHAIVILPLLLLAAVLRVSDFWSSYVIIVRREGSLLRWQGWGMVFVFVAWVGWVLSAGQSVEPALRFAVLAAVLAFVSHATSVLLSYLSVRKAI